MGKIELEFGPGAAMTVQGPSPTAVAEDSQPYTSSSSEELALTLQFKNVASLVFHVSKISSVSKDIYRFPCKYVFRFLL